MPARARLRAVSPSCASRPPDGPIKDVVALLSREQLVEVVVAAVDRHDDVQRAVRLIAARADGDLSQLRAAIDGGLRTRRFLDYRGSITWAHAARPIIVELEATAAESPSRELVELLQRAVGHIVKVIMRADDSSGRRSRGKTSRLDDLRLQPIRWRCGGRRVREPAAARPAAPLRRVRFAHPGRRLAWLLMSPASPRCCSPRRS
jgi:hypothetical protein